MRCKIIFQLLLKDAILKKCSLLQQRLSVLGDRQMSVHDILKLDTKEQYEINVVSPTISNHEGSQSSSSSPHVNDTTSKHQLSLPGSPIRMTSVLDSWPTEISFSEPFQKENRTISPQPQHLEKVFIEKYQPQNGSGKYELQEIQGEERLFEDMSCLSILAKGFVAGVHELADVRELFCRIEYPESFTGSEALVRIRFHTQALLVHVLTKDVDYHQTTDSQRIFRRCLSQSCTFVNEDEPSIVLSYFLF